MNVKQSPHFLLSLTLTYTQRTSIMSAFSPGGYAACSLAIMSDAAHLLIDFGSILMSLFSLWLSSRPPTHALTLGWLRAGEIGKKIKNDSFFNEVTWLFSF